MSLIKEVDKVSGNITEMICYECEKHSDVVLSLNELKHYTHQVSNAITNTCIRDITAIEGYINNMPPISTDRDFALVLVRDLKNIVALLNQDNIEGVYAWKNWLRNHCE